MPFSFFSPQSQQGQSGGFDISNMANLLHSQRMAEPNSYNPGNGTGGGAKFFGDMSAPMSAGGDSNSENNMNGMMSYGGSDNSLLQPRIMSITPNGGMGGNNNLIQSLIKALQGQTQQANTASLGQYKNLLKSISGAKGTVNSEFGQAQDLMKNYGQSGLQQLGIETAHQKGQTEQDMVSRGLGNTTIRQSALQGVQRNADLARNNLTEGIAAQRAGLLTQQAGATQNMAGLEANAITSRQNQSPDISQFINLLMALGQGGGMGGMPSGITASTFGERGV